MHYREIGKTGVKVSALGFGAMRLPTIDDKYDRINEKEAISMIRTALDKGVNYLDTAYGYHGGTSEDLCGKALKDGYREKAYIATKMPSWEVKSYDDLHRLLDEQLTRLDVEYIDFYLLHTLTKAYWDIYKAIDYKKFIKEAMDMGKIKHIGFSFHDNLELFKEITDDYDWEFCQIQLNYLDETYQAGLEGMRYAAERDMGVIIMEPLRGGMLAREEIPQELQAIWDKSPVKRRPVQWGLSYLFDHPEVSLVLSGMSTMEQVEDNIETAREALPGFLSGEERDVIGRAKEFYKSRIRVNCTSCQYCMPCPAGVNIPELFWGYNHDGVFGDFKKGQFWTTGFLKPHARAYNCIECGACETKCPQNIEIIKHLKKITELYGRGEE
ncbi:MAG: aldo/keto reductase [Spirochaetales bacterium]|nr:aldo/keto reductase [Spirochaetales bacterium]